MTKKIKKTQKPAKRNSGAKSANKAKFTTNLSGFKKSGKNADGKNIKYSELVNETYKTVHKNDKKITKSIVKDVVGQFAVEVAQSLGKSNKCSASIPYLGTFKTSVRKYNVGGKSGNTKAVKFTPAKFCKASAKLGKK